MNASRASSSRSARRRPSAATCAASSRGTHTTPSSSATTASPGRITVPAMLTGVFTAPAIALPVPWALTNRDQTGKRAAVMAATSRTPVVVTSPLTPRAASEVVISSPAKPSPDGDVVVTTSRSPGRACSMAACSMRLSPGPHSTVSAVPAARARPGRPERGAEQPGLARGLVHGGHAELAQLGHHPGVRAGRVHDHHWLHASTPLTWGKTRW